MHALLILTPLAAAPILALAPHWLERRLTRRDKAALEAVLPRLSAATDAELTVTCDFVEKVDGRDTRLVSGRIAFRGQEPAEFLMTVDTATGRRRWCKLKLSDRDIVWQGSSSSRFGKLVGEMMRRTSPPAPAEDVSAA